MAIAFDSSSAGNATNVSSLTYTHTVVSNSNGVILVGVELVDSNSRTITGITYNGVAMTEISAISPYTPAGGRYHGMWYLFAPATGANSVVVTLSGAVSNNIVSASLAYTGVLQSGLPDASVKTFNASVSSGSSLTATLTSVASSCWLAGFGTNEQSTPTTAGTNTTKRSSSAYGNCFVVGFDSNAARTAGSNSIAFISGISTDNMTWQVISIAPASVAVINGNFLAFM